MKKKLQVAVLVENHPYDVVGFQKMLDSFDDCKCYVQPIDLFVQDELNQMHYDTVLYYNMNIPMPAEDSPIRRYMETKLGTTGQGIVLMHHALLSFKHWELYTDVSGVRIRLEDGMFQYHQNQTVNVHVEDDAHPVTKGLRDFAIVDETYIIGEPEEPGNTILLTTDNPVSIKKIAWVRNYKKSRVFCTASGHDAKVYGDPNFRTLLNNAILWTSGKA